MLGLIWIFSGFIECVSRWIWAVTQIHLKSNRGINPINLQNMFIYILIRNQPFLGHVFTLGQVEASSGPAHPSHPFPQVKPAPPSTMGLGRHGMDSRGYKPRIIWSLKLRKKIERRWSHEPIMGTHRGFKTCVYVYAFNAWEWCNFSFQLFLLN